MNFPNLISIQAIEKYKLFLSYDDGTKGVLNLSHLAGEGVFQYWEEANNFFNVSINPQGGGITWSKELDICPDAAYLNIKGISFEEWREQTKSRHATN